MMSSGVRNTHWCYQCNRPVCPRRQGMVCPYCEGGFIEKLHELSGGGDVGGGFTGGYGSFRAGEGPDQLFGIMEGLNSLMVQNHPEHRIGVMEALEVPDIVEEPLSRRNRITTLRVHVDPRTKVIQYLVLFFILVCLAPVVYVILTVATFIILPLLLVVYVVCRLVQFVIPYQVFVSYYESKILLRFWILAMITLLLIELGLFYPIARFVPHVKVVIIIGLHISKWIEIIAAIIGIYLINQVIWLSLGVVIRDYNSVHVLEGLSEICGCFLFLWAEAVVMHSVPIFKQSTIFGVHIRKWFEVSVFVLVVYNVISLLTHVIVMSSPRLFANDFGISEKLNACLNCLCFNNMRKSTFRRKYVVYIAMGIKRSIIFMLSIVMLLVTWLTYFNDHLNTPMNKTIMEFGTQTLISLLICSCFWLIKACILLYWEAHVVHIRLHSKIEDIGKQLYFLIIFNYSHNVRIPPTPRNGLLFNSCCCASSETDEIPYTRVEGSPEGNGRMYHTYEVEATKKILIDNVGTKASMYDLQQAADRISSTQYTWSKERQNNIPFIGRDDLFDARDEDITDKLKSCLHESWTMLEELVASEHPTGQIYHREFQAWMERAHTRCRFLANTLLSEKEVINLLNKIMSCLIIFVTSVIWLLMSGLATTSILVLIASPLLAASFIFGDTCKSLFQGLIFVYGVHPFDVGDLCDIDNTLLEVKKIGLWCTAFTNVRTVGKQQEVLYPNSTLAAKNMTNYKTEFNWKDQISFSLKSSTKEAMTNLRLQIENYLDEEKHRFTPHFHGVEFIESDDKVKIVVHINHHVKSKGWTYLECLKEKEKRRFECAIHIQDIINQQESKTETTGVLTSTTSSAASPTATEQKQESVPTTSEQNQKPKKNICCACPDTKRLRDDCIVQHGEDVCQVDRGS